MCITSFCSSSGHFDTMPVQLRRGRDDYRTETLSSLQGARSTIALHFRYEAVDQTDVLNLDSFLVARAETDVQVRDVQGEWEAVLNGTRRGFDLTSALALSAQMAPSEARRRPTRPQASSERRRKDNARSAGNSIMTCLLSFLTVELCRGRQLGEDGFAPGYETFGYKEKTFTSITRNGTKTKSKDLKEKAQFQADPELTRQMYSVIATAERTACQVQDPSWNPLELDPYKPEGRPCRLHKDAAGALGDPPGNTETFGSVSQSGPAFTYTLNDARTLVQTRDEHKLTENLNQALMKVAQGTHNNSRPTYTDTTEGNMSLDDDTEDSSVVELETTTELLEEEYFAEASGSQAWSFGIYYPS